MRRRTAAAAAGGVVAAVVLIVALTHRGPPQIDVPPRVRTPPADAYARPFGVSVRLEAAQADARYVRLVLSRFTSVTPENEMKWQTVQPTRGRFDFDRADAIVELARRAGKRVRGHTLTWDIQLPLWLAEGEWSAREMEAVLRAHVRRTVGHFRGRVQQWDVVNEPLDDDGSLTQSVFARSLGERFIDIAFDEAHKADPGAKLFLNEIGSEFPSAKRDALVALVRRLERRGVPIDGVGLQGHASTARTPGRRLWTADIRRFGALGLDVELTEVDIGIRPGRSAGAGQLARQARAYRAAAAACRAVKACTGITLWGATDRWSWLGAERHATPFTASGEPKPAASALAEALGR